MRDTTERPEAVDAGTVRLGGTDTYKIVSAVSELLENKQSYIKMSVAYNPYCDGNACGKIIQSILQG